MVGPVQAAVFCQGRCIVIEHPCEGEEHARWVCCLRWLRRRWWDFRPRRDAGGGGECPYRLQPCRRTRPSAPCVSSTRRRAGTWCVPPVFSLRPLSAARPVPPMTLTGPRHLQVTEAKVGDLLLDVADSVGIHIPRGCKSGMCGSCTCDLKDPEWSAAAQSVRLWTGSGKHHVRHPL